MKLSRAQELYLIELGLQAIIDKHMHRIKSSRTANRTRWKKAGKRYSRSWTPERHKKFAETMARKFGKKERSS